MSLSKSSKVKTLGKSSAIFTKTIVQMNDISASYDSKNYVLKDISMSIDRGTNYAIVGHSGSGKSTLLKLINGMMNPTRGKILVDYQKPNISDKKFKSFMHKIGYIPQSVYLIDDTIRKNIAFGLLEDDIDDALIDQAVEKASLNKFLNILSEGLETVVGEKGIRLSGGQQQRIGIARALYRNPEILILDEATNSLDQATEKKIMESIQFLKRKKTLIIVTHRLSMVKNCDKIFFIDKGKITKQGSPEKILNNI